MKITSITQITVFIVETDEDEFSTYQRSGPDNWQVAMGESWEPVYYCEKLEAMFQAFQTRPQPMPV